MLSSSARESTCLLLGIFLTVASLARGAELSGQVELHARGGERLARDEAGYGLVYFVPSAGIEAEFPPLAFDLSTKKKRFSPRVLPVTIGSTVRFPNEDPILHNVFSVSPGNSFDVGLYGAGEGAEHTFETPGLVRVFCNVHHSMVAYIMVLETPYYARPGADGRFLLDGLPPGPGRLTVWQERAGARTLEVDVPSEEPLTVRLEVTRRRVPKHLNKFGRPYARRSRERYE